LIDPPPTPFADNVDMESLSRICASSDSFIQLKITISTFS
jgi:hypothetical protein